MEASAKYLQWGLQELLDKYRGLRIAPTSKNALQLKGQLSFHVTGPNGVIVEDDYAVTIRIPMGFPRDLPQAWETGGRIPDQYHKFGDDSLCLGAPTAQGMRLNQSAKLLTYVDEFVVPYLYGYSCYERDGTFPFGELAHGKVGLLEYLASLFNAPQASNTHHFMQLASFPRRRANKHPCPCGSGRRLGQCHHRAVNRVRDKMGRLWCRAEFDWLREQLDNQPTAAERRRQDDVFPRVSSSLRRRLTRTTSMSKLP